nr:UDP-N-acetylglucosamine 2-epimerase (hydrolyzing) [Planctomycetales bacterium]
MAPDFVIVIGDRHEALGAALGAAYTGQCLVHFQGGESSGTIDESARHAITQLAHYHVPATQRAKARLVQMCQRESTILTVGCPSSDLARSVMPEDRDEILVVYHPSGNLHEVEQILQARADLEGGLRWRWLWPNIDAGANEIHKLLRRFKAEWGDGWIDFETNMAPRDYLKTLASVRCAVGNSSSFVRDSSFFGTPVVLVGERQMGREHAAN